MELREDEGICVVCAEPLVAERPGRREYEWLRSRVAEIAGDPLGGVGEPTGRWRDVHLDCVAGSLWREHAACTLPDPALTDELLARLRVRRELLERQALREHQGGRLGFWFALLRSADGQATRVLLRRLRAAGDLDDGVQRLLNLAAIALTFAEAMREKPQATEAEWRELATAAAG